MSVQIKLENDDKGVVFICDGIVTADELIDATGEIQSNKNIQYQLCDFSRAKDIRIDIEQMHKIAIQDNSYTIDSKLSHILFVGDISKWKHLYESYEQMSKDWVGRRTGFTTAIFNNIEEARIWLKQNT